MEYDIWKNIQKSMLGWRYALGYVEAKAEESITGWGMGISHVGSQVGEHFGNIGESFGNITSGFRSIKLWLLIPILILAFIAIMVSIGYSGLGGPAARVAEREHARRR